MFYQIISFLLDVVTGLVAGACLLRLYMQWQYVGFANPIGRLVFALTDWLVLPLRRLVPSVGRMDTSSVLAALLLELVQYVVLWGLSGAHAPVAALAVLALFGALRLAVSGMTGLLLVYAILSWVPTRSSISDVIERLCAPPLQPVRRVVPLVGGVDLSPLVLLVLLQVLAMVLGEVQRVLLQAV